MTRLSQCWCGFLKVATFQWPLTKLGLHPGGADRFLTDFLPLIALSATNADSGDSLGYLSGSNQSSLALLPEAVALALDGIDMAVVQEPIQDRRGQHRIPEHLALVSHRLVAGEDQAAPLVSAVHQLEKQVSRPTLERQVA